MYWQKVVQEVLNKNNPSYYFAFTHNEHAHRKCETVEPVPYRKRGRKSKQYGLGQKYPKVFFTRRESQCMVEFIRGQTIMGTAYRLELSPRTVEFYLKKMKNKVGCHSKVDLINIVIMSEFLNNVDF